MNETFLEDFLSEPERYELHEGSPAWELSRREFFRIVGGGVVVALLFTEGAEGQQPQRGQRGGGGGVPQDISAWLHVGEDSIVTVYTGKTEIGQNIRTSLTQLVAEELHTPVERIRLVMADTARVPYDGGTAGSRTTPSMAPQLRRAAAAAREALLDLAAEQGKVERTSLAIVNGKVVGRQGKPEFEFGQLTRGQKLMKVLGASNTGTPPDKWVVAGQPVPKVDGRSFVTGTHQYASDIRRPDMVFGKILRPPAFKAKLQSVLTKEAEALPGVTVVHEGDFVGVTAPTELAATQALAALRPEWQTVAQPSGKDLYKHLKEQRSAGRGGGGFGGGRNAQGSVPEGLKQADEVAKATYTIAYIAHVPLEPRVGVAEWADGKMTVWTGTQRPFGVRGEVAGALRIPEDRVRVIVPDMGSGYGGKHTGEAAVEAARLARAVGKPVKVAWTREEEFTWAYFRPAGVIDITAGAKKDGALTAWEFHNYNSGGSGLRTPYGPPNLLEEFHSSDSPLRQGSYRALASTANHFARESHIDDLARALHLDPLAFRLRNLKDARMRAVLEAAAKKFGWGEAKPAAGHGFGLAVGTEKGSYVATCAEIALNSQGGPPRVVRLTTAFECGAILNPDGLKNQVEGCALMGLGGALFEEIDFDNGRILNPRFSGYRVPRFRDTPILETVLLNRPDLPSAGAGETPIVTIAPAIGNALFQATGTRLRSLPMIRKGLPT